MAIASTDGHTQRVASTFFAGDEHGRDSEWESMGYLDGSCKAFTHRSYWAATQMAYVVFAVAAELLSTRSTTQTQAISYLIMVRELITIYKLVLSFEARRRVDVVESRSALAALHPVFLANAIIAFAQDRFG